ncbi:MAG: prepilin peptidase [Halothiobacillus sp. 14-56-357]|jgi:leader peptidase (prepilin peptidase)/N-methyltransferase|uniref:prepilin peptidase n=1 Tax=Halothiobacillus sp. 15-55-196 TaxID=1970382 RepID=UPI000BD585F3|nr:A24 family peptidase [Halothiobacillus sp. 15-55-196]OZB37078.1 MAG: prepilin peptidase [Halothiobacillus sp. 15-55-196]OZB56124.1 MAG: prepilin peptidase [Halothiobacillus sp. 14-56-357]OZB78014.1 MAG: prepilin peptidase [Halothiobacillus sp. 13-55-115]
MISTWVGLFNESPILWLSVALILGLLVGSFLNVVIYRLPIMLEQGWRRDCQELLEIAPSSNPEVYNLITPRSACPHCHAPIKAWQNIPIISWLWLRGKCAHCQHGISIQYPLIELTSGLLTLLPAWYFGVSETAVAVWFFSWILLAAAIIDLKTTLLPDNLTLPLMWLGILLALTGFGTTVTLENAVLGAMAGYLALWSIYWLFKLITGREGMGYGDFKLLAALGAWLGWQQLPMVLLLSAGVGAVVGIGMILFLKHDKRIPIPFGPYLAGAGLLAYYFGDTLFQMVFGISGTY